ncbi:hypothetical protein ACFL6U_02520 [Planctomycetota bacterium]
MIDPTTDIASPHILRLTNVEKKLSAVCDTSTQGDLEQACVYMEAAGQELRVQGVLPHDDIDLWVAFGKHLVFMGVFPVRVGLLKQLLALHPWDAVTHSHLLLCQHFIPGFSSEKLAFQHRRWGTLHGVSPEKLVPYPHERNPDRSLRIGYISGDFCSHSVAYFIEAILEGHNRRDVSVWGYGHIREPDAVTARIQAACDHYRDITEESDDQVDGWIREDRIDVLVDLSGHTEGRRLEVFVRRPAPVQVSYLGYPDTTGLEQMNYRLTDSWTDDSQSQEYYTETLVFLEGGFLCYRPPGLVLPVQPSPVLRRKKITFGSFNDSSKINTAVLDLWSRVLVAVPGAGLLLKFRGGDSDRVSNHFLRQFQRRGIDPGRIQIVGWLPQEQHLALYNEIDVVLDTFPYNGTTTTCEALWMGVAVISLVGTHHVSRVGLSLLNQVGLEFFAAQDSCAYVAKAAALASKPEALATLRESMRNRLLRSLLCDKVGFVRRVEKAYREMWQHWCKTQ